MKRKGKVFIDANVIINAENFRSADVLQWINDLYEEIYIHIKVLNELQISSTRKRAQEFIDCRKWQLFDPLEEKFVTSDELYDMYNKLLEDMRGAFRKLDEKKEMLGRRLKKTNDLGEIHSLAAAMLLNANIICSNDWDIREVIEDTPIIITIGKEEQSILMQQDTLEDLCCFFVSLEVAERGIVRKFLKAIHPERIPSFDLRINI